MTNQRRVFVFMLLATVFSAMACPSAMAEALDLSDSAKATKVQRLHEAALDELVEEYFKSLDLSEERYAKTSIQHIRRYTDGLNRAKAQHVRAGNESPVVFIEALIDLAASWTITAPDTEGKHFLSDADLIVPGDEAASKLGTDLIGRIEKLGPSYQRKADAAFARYETRVQAARKEFVASLEKAHIEELRAGQHKAVIQIKDALKELENQKAFTVERPRKPEPHQQADADEPIDPDGPINDADKPATVQELLANGYPESMRGVYVGHFPNSRSSSAERLILVLRQDGVEVVGWYYQFNRDGEKFKLATTEARLLERDGEELLFHSKSGIGRDMIFEIHTGRGNHSKAPFWTSADAYKAGEKPGEATTYKLWQHGLQRVLKDGKYQLQLQASTDPDGKAVKGEVAMHIEVIGSQAFRPAQRCKVGSKNFTLAPAGFTHMPTDTWTHFHANSYFANQTDLLHVETAGGNEPLVKYWWSKYDQRDGKPPDMIGKIVPVKD